MVVFGGLPSYVGFHLYLDNSDGRMDLTGEGKCPFRRLVTRPDLVAIKITHYFRYIIAMEKKLSIKKLALTQR
jgi:hypothetical protein